MSSAFTLTMAYLAETCGAEEAAGALAAHVTGNVAGNLFGRLVSAAIADHLGLAPDFRAFALLNLAAALMVAICLGQTAPMIASPGRQSEALQERLCDPSLRASFAIGFVILFALIGTFSYVSFVLDHGPGTPDRMAIGLVHVWFLPSMDMSPLAGPSASRPGTRPAFRHLLLAIRLKASAPEPGFAASGWRP